MRVCFGSASDFPQLLSLPAAHQPAGDVAHQADAARGPRPEAHRHRAAGGRVLHDGLHPVAPAHHVPHRAAALLNRADHGRGAQPATPPDGH